MSWQNQKGRIGDDDIDTFSWCSGL